MQARMGDRPHLAFQHAGLAGADDLQHIVTLAFEGALVEHLRQAQAGNILPKTAHQRGTGKPGLEIRAIVHRFIEDQVAEQRRQRAGGDILAHHEAALFRALEPVVEQMAGIIMAGLAHHRETLLKARIGLVYVRPYLP